MTNYDFVVTHSETINGILNLSTEKVAVLDDDVTLDAKLKSLGVDDWGIGIAIEQLEAIPYGAKNATVQGRDGKILIEQIN